MNTTIERPDGINLYVVYADSNTHDDTTHHLFLFLSLLLLLYASFFSVAACT